MRYQGTDCRMTFNLRERGRSCASEMSVMSCFHRLPIATILSGCLMGAACGGTAAAGDGGSTTATTGASTSTSGGGSTGGNVGSSTGGATTTGSSTSSSGASTGGTTSSFVPAPHNPFPQRPNNGTPALANPQIVTLSYAGYPYDIAGYAATLAQSSMARVGRRRLPASASSRRRTSSSTPPDASSPRIRSPIC